jgi:hypothetical protein
VIATLVSSWLPTKRTSIEFGEDGDAVTMSADGAGDLRSTLLRDPDGTAFTLRGGGFIHGFGMEEAELAPTSAGWSDSEMPQNMQTETKSGARGDFAWAA